MNSQPTLWFVTDPMCSWCWGMLPEMEKVREALAGRVDVQLMLGGVQLGNKGLLAIHDENNLFDLWREVGAVTGQSFSGKLPAVASFRYHSEVACRAIKVMERITGEPPFGFLGRVQHAFYFEARDISDSEVLADLAGAQGSDRQGFIDAMHSPDVIAVVRSEFDTVKKLGASALPTVLLDVGEGPRLVSGGYCDSTFLLTDLEHWLTPRPNL